MYEKTHSTLHTKNLLQFLRSIIPIGTVMVWPTADIPTYGHGVWLECNGQSFSRTQFPQLYETLGTTRVPDYQGVFLRGYGTSDDFRVENVNGDGANISVSSGEIGEIQPMADLPFFFYTPAMYVSWADSWNFVELPAGKFGKMHRAWTYKNSTDENDTTFPSFWVSDSYNGVYPWILGTEHFVPVHPKHYKYTISCSGGGGDGEEGGGGASCELNEERVDFEFEEGIYLQESGYGHLYFTNYYNSPVTADNDLRPANIAVKFMIKAK